MTRLALAGVAAAALAGPAGATARESGKSSTAAAVVLSGKWVINEKLSDDPQAFMQKRGGPGAGGGKGGGYGPGPGGPPGGGNGGGYGPGPGGGAGDGDRDRIRERARTLARPKELTIVQSGEQILMIPETADTVRIVPDGETRTVARPAGTMETTARWNGPVLEIDHTSAVGRQATRIYRIDADGRLEVTTKIPAQDGKPAATFVTRYDEKK
jgi:hypothetical protein